MMDNATDVEQIPSLFHTYGQSVALVALYLIVNISMLGNISYLHRLVSQYHLVRMYPLLTNMLVPGAMLSVTYMPLLLLQEFMHVFEKANAALCILQTTLWIICEQVLYISVSGLAIQRTRLIRATFFVRPTIKLEFVAVVLSWTIGVIIALTNLAQLLSKRSSAEVLCLDSNEQASTVASGMGFVGCVVTVLTVVTSYSLIIQYLKTVQNQPQPLPMYRPIDGPAVLRHSGLATIEEAITHHLEEDHIQRLSAAQSSVVARSMCSSAITSTCWATR